MRENIDVVDDKCCNTCQNGFQVYESELGYCIDCRKNNEMKDASDICDKYNKLN